VPVLVRCVVVKVVDGVLANVNLMSEDFGVNEAGGEFQVAIGDVTFVIAKGDQSIRY
jgi:hypothetical protein